ncbi:hypothetical protein M758_1G153800 [Ceratodon purpureus]|nr:hypothetical protein M758_1G153800 [Ceratodon purpureus]
MQSSLVTSDVTSDDAQIRHKLDDEIRERERDHELLQRDCLVKCRSTRGDDEDDDGGCCCWETGDDEREEKGKRDVDTSYSGLPGPTTRRNIRLSSLTQPNPL